VAELVQDTERPRGDLNLIESCTTGNQIFYINEEIHVRSLANFYCQYADRHMDLKFMRRVSEREWAIRQS